MIEKFDLFKIELLRYEKNRDEAILQGLIDQNLENFHELIKFLSLCFGMAVSDSLGRTGKINFKQGLVKRIEYRTKSIQSIYEKTRMYEGNRILLPPRELYQNLPCYPFYDIYGILIIAYGIDDVYNIVIPLLMNEFDLIMSMKDYIRNPHENGYQAIHLLLRSKCALGFNSAFDIHIQDIIMNERNSNSDYHKRKMKYFINRSLRLKPTVIHN